MKWKNAEEINALDHQGVSRPKSVGWTDAGGLILLRRQVRRARVPIRGAARGHRRRVREAVPGAGPIHFSSKSQQFSK
jgi:hypothetical protein